MNFGIRPAEKRSLVAQVEGDLGDALIESRLRPGERLVTRDLADALGTSITPVREALVRLASSGALRAEPASAFRVPQLTEAETLELARIRKAVECLAAAEAALNATAEDIADLRQLMAEYIAARPQPDPAEALRCNRRFRFAVYALARMPQLMQVIETLWMKSGPGFNYLYQEKHADFTGHRNYEDLLNALAAHDQNGARLAIEHAIDDGTQAVVQAMRSSTARAASGT